MLETKKRQLERATRHNLVPSHDRVSADTGRFVDSIAYSETLCAFTQKWQDLRDISLRIAGKSPWLRDERDGCFGRTVS
jgi:hypothetical protein